MVAQALKERPNECCGLLAGRLGPAGSVPAGDIPLAQVVRRYPLVNAAHSPREYLSDDRSMLEAVKGMRVLGLEVLAVYHSHPTTDPVPSRTDLERNYWPGVVCFIISLKAAEPLVRGWLLGEADYTPADWECVEATQR
jgi:proteasome lid subunit RPN8/RPN11